MKYLISLFLLTLSLFYTSSDAAESKPAYTIIENKAKIPVLTPSLVDQKILKIKLANGLEAMLVSDQKADRSAAVISVKAGSWQDPKDYPGIAHFLEHMLFLGTQKFPEESGYQRFIFEHGGETNAFTSNDFTSYMFSVSNDAFEEALDRFSFFFKEPLFNPSGVSRELNAIDQEYAKNIENDDIRELYVIKELGNPNHPNHAFNMGNSKTLSKVSRETLKEWYENHYSANLMKLVVYSPLPLDKLKELVVKDFGGISNKNTPFLSLNTPVNTDQLEGKIVYIEPIKNVRSLTLAWFMPPKFADMKNSKPDSLACYVLGHEGKESLLAELKRERLAEKLNCGSSRLGPGSLAFYLEIELTDEGVHQYAQVIERTFQAIATFKQKGIPKYIFDEVHRMAVINYQYHSREDAFDTAMKDASYISEEDMATYPEQTLIIQKYDPNHVKEFLDYLTPQHCQFFLKAPSSLTGIKYDHLEKWLGVSYAIEPIDSEKMLEWESLAPGFPNIDIPSPNPFIPQKLELKNDKKEIPAALPLVPQPNAIIDNDRAKIYFAHDLRYQIPKVYWFLEIKTPQIEVGKPIKVVLGDIFVRTLNEALNKFSYDATVAGLDYKIERTDNGISLYIEGYSENAPLLFDEILKQLKSFTITEQKFKLYKQSLLREYQNFAKDTPLKQATEILKSAVYKNFTTEKQKAFAIRKVTYEKFTEYLTEIFKQNYLEGILYGNMDEIEAKQLAEKLIDQLGGNPYSKKERYKPKVIILPKEEGPFYLENTTNVLGNAVILSIESNNFSFKNRAAQQILMQAMNTPFFSTLRTKQQTGYLVYSTGEEWERQMFNFFAVQSNTHDVRDLLARFELFIEGYLQEIGKSELTEEQFHLIKHVLLTKLTQPQLNMKDMGDLLKTLAFKYDGDFNWLDKRIEGLKDLSYFEFVTYSKEVMGRSNKQRLAVLLKGNIPRGNALDYIRLSSLEQLRKMSAYKSFSEVAFKGNPAQ